MEAIAIAGQTRETIPDHLEGVRAGDPTSLAALVTAFDADILRLAFLVGGDIEQARDAAQATWERLWRNPPSLRDPERLRSWLLTVAANEARHASRRRRRGAFLERAAGMAPAESADPGDQVAYLDLQHALRGLSAQERELLGLRYVLDWTSPMSAAHLKVSPEGVRTRLRRALGKLREDLTHG